jgi:hypothetical protein
MNKAILIIPIIAVLLSITTSTAVQARAGDGFDSGYNKGKSYTLNNHSFGDLCLSTGTYCDNYKRGYMTGWVEMHMATGTLVLLDKRYQFLDMIVFACLEEVQY